MVTFAYCASLKETFDLDQPLSSRAVFTSVVLAQIPAGASIGTSLSVREAITPSHITTVQTGSRVWKTRACRMQKRTLIVQRHG